jgi:hypothetical protein
VRLLENPSTSWFDRSLSVLTTKNLALIGWYFLFEKLKTKENN